MKKKVLLILLFISSTYAQNIIKIADTEANPGDTNVAVPIIMVNTNDYVSGIQFTFHYDSRFIQFVNVEAGDRLSGTSFNVSYNSFTDSTNVVVLSLSGDSLAPDSSGELVIFYFNVSDTVENDSLMLTLSRVILSSPDGVHLPVVAENGVLKIISQPRAFVIALADTESIGGQVELPIKLSHPNDAVSGIQFTLAFDSTEIIFDSLISLLPSNFTCSVNSFGDSVRVVYISLSGDSIAPSNQDTLIGTVFFNLSSSVMPDDSIPVEIRGVVISNPQAQHIPSAGIEGYIAIAPMPPEVIGPNGYVNSRLFEIIWRSILGGECYISELSDINDFSTLIDSAEVNDTIYQVNVVNDGTYFVRVKSRSARGYESDWSEIDSFIVDATPPEIVNLIEPESGAMLNRDNVEFIWNGVIDSVSGVSGYWLEVSNDSELFSDSVWAEDTVYEMLLSDSVWYWRVKAVDEAGNEGEWSEVRRFEVDTREPEAPTLVSPVDSIWLSNDTVDFVWSKVVFKKKELSKSTPVRYVLELDGNVIDSAISDTSYTTQVPEGMHIWRLRAYDLAGNSSEWSDSGYFGVDITSPVIDSMTTISDTVRLLGPWTIHAWVRDNVSGIDSVLLFYQIDSGTQWQEVVMSGSSNGEWLGEIPELTDTFIHNIRYYIKATDHAGNITLSDTLNFVAIKIEERFNILSFKLIPFGTLVKQGDPIKLQMEIPYNEKIDLIIYNSVGRKVWEKNYFLDKGIHRVDITPNLNSGMYIMNVRFGDCKEYRIKFLVF